MRNSEEPFGRCEAVELLSHLITDVSLLCDASLVEARRDADTISRRVQCEGLGFLTKVLPSLRKAIDESFETRVLKVPRGFATSRGSKIPVFLRGILRLVYTEDGVLRNLTEEVIEAVRGLRQILEFFYKLETGYSDKVTDAFIRSFIETDASLPEVGTLPDSVALQNAAQLLEELLCDFNPMDIVPGHGPGAVATGERAAEKWVFSRIYRSIDSMYPFEQYYCSSGFGEFADRREWANGLQWVDEPVARTILVPKDSRGPRIISEEPLEVQWIQQGIKSELYAYVEAHPLTRGRVNFTDQEVNGELALWASRTGRYATLDLKDASDRVSLALLDALFPEHIVEACKATRSASTDLPSGGRLRLRKYASMGSALCFPIEALTFWALSLGVLNALSPGRNRLKTSGVYVYGDDLIVPVEIVPALMEQFEALGLRFSHHKCYYRGSFRESCGVEALDGVDITPVRVKHFPYEDQVKPPLSSLVPHLDSLSDSLWSRGYWRAASYVGSLLERLIPVPYGVEGSPFVCKRLRSASDAVRLNLRQPRLRPRWNHGLQRLEFLTHSVRTKCVEIDTYDHTAEGADINREGGWGRLLRGLTTTVGDRPTQFPTRETWLKKSYNAV